MTTEAAPKLTMPVSDARDHIIGRSDAPVTLVEYGDYECPYCRQVHHIIAELQEMLGDRLCYVFRHFPIRTAHPHAQTAAQAAEAAVNPLSNRPVGTTTLLKSYPNQTISGL